MRAMPAHRCMLLGRLPADAMRTFTAHLRLLVALLGYSSRLSTRPPCIRWNPSPDRFVKLVQHQSHVEAPARPRHSLASNFSETENYPGPNEAWLSAVQHGYSVASDEKLLETSHGVGTGRPCVAPSPPRRDPTGGKK